VLVLCSCAAKGVATMGCLLGTARFRLEGR
jgi:hypothetical protein